MSKISYPQLVKNLADAYRVCIGSTDPIVIGELTTKITEVMNSSEFLIYKSIVYNEDNTITLIDNDDITHTMSCVYEDDKVVSVIFDGEEVLFNYDGDTLVGINDLEFNLENAPSFNVGESATQKSMSVESGVEVIPPILAEPLIVEINNSNIEIETSVALESEE